MEHEREKTFGWKYSNAIIDEHRKVKIFVLKSFVFWILFKKHLYSKSWNSIETKDGRRKKLLEVKIIVESIIRMKKQWCKKKKKTFNGKLNQKKNDDTICVNGITGKLNYETEKVHH